MTNSSTINLQRFLETQEFDVLDKPLDFEQTPSFRNYLCCLGAAMCACTYGFSICFVPIATFAGGWPGIGTHIEGSSTSRPHAVLAAAGWQSQACQKQPAVTQALLQPTYRCSAPPMTCAQAHVQQAHQQQLTGRFACSCRRQPERPLLTAAGQGQPALQQSLQ
jgi:hypothetical protein